MVKIYKLLVPIKIGLPSVSHQNIKIAKHLLYFAISFSIPLVLLTIYLNYAKTQNTILEHGCEGPEMVFGLFSGILMAIFLRFDHSD